MSIQFDTARTQAYMSGVELLVQQKGSRLRNAVRVETGVVGKYAYFDQISATSAVERTSRHADTPQIDTPHARRRVAMRDFEWADLIDDQDRIRTIHEFGSPYQVNAANAMGRSMDDILIEAATATAYTGESGGTSETFDTSNYQISSGSAGLTVAKLITAKKMLDEAENDPDEPRFLLLSAEQVEDLLNTTEVKSSDYNSVKALVQGQVDTFLGFKFIRTERLGTVSSERGVLAFAKSALLLAVGKDMTARIGERADKSYATQVYTSMTIGATRMRSNGIVRILCTE